MSLYNRNLSSQQSDFSRAYESEQSISARATFVKQTYKLLSASLLAATAGAYIGVDYVKSFSWGLLILEFAMLFGLFFTRKNPTLALFLLFGFTFVSGLTLGPALNTYIGAGMGHIITQAFLMTTVAFGGLTIFAFNTKRDFSSMGKMLFIALIVIVVAGLLNLFFQSTMLATIISAVGAILFSAYILYDTQMILRGGYDSPVLAAVSLYLDILNLFISLLNLLGIFNRE
ncbi:Bax inhibitor-1/YccA family protein [Campylobacter lanienae]|uniref:Bax inhibitor-1/YccA family protein n=1 Tax=Campylobacter lanienae TaxID=75658 RepID=UPI0021BF9230|nr:Bax inhibitor-1/YccA family protein [Campylobacter lanienae]